ncbi:MAG: Asp-tRNA(Asn)/Glu-tRNA(Gln) amidotransferase subunit GatC [Gammaproteobacteria bacterium]|jgi:aspartyl-tRNA(Asn)/glutamyl-tRNA(Gln) amidotransferase subunit C|nr:Asp-tRNA(Asn)/Glu-tRNA(Gln) amidotransferase subunit GatC [Gammaproteobacteria bacterium]|tara:strand:- start:15688 stop:15975 length:288 start_codon:yes stop_codon:yes gene_type:complete
MALTTAEILNIAKLARLHVEEAELADYQQELSAILGFVEQMEEVNVDAVEAMAHPQDMAQSLREDVVTESDQRDHFQSIAPATANGLYLVPKVIE